MQLEVHPMISTDQREYQNVIVSLAVTDLGGGDSRILLPCTLTRSLAFEHQHQSLNRQPPIELRNRPNVRSTSPVCVCCRNILYST